MKRGKSKPAKEKKPVTWKTRVKDLATYATILGIGHSALSWVDNAYLQNIWHNVVDDSKDREVQVYEDLEYKLMSEKALEKKLGVDIRGPVDPAIMQTLDVAYDICEFDEVPLFDSVDTVINITRDVDYSGSAAPWGTLHLVSHDLDTVFHELAHLHSFTLDDKFWDEWTQHSKHLYRHNLLGGNGTILGDKIRRQLGAKPRKREESRGGIVEDYGFSDKDEDLATFVETCYTGFEKLKDVPSEDLGIYLAKVDLLEEYEFINERRAKDARSVLNGGGLVSVENALRNFLSDGHHAQMQEYSPASMGVSYKLADIPYDGSSRIRITYTSHMASGISIQLVGRRGACQTVASIGVSYVDDDVFENYDQLPRDIFERLAHQGYLSKKWSYIGAARNERDVESAINQGYDIIGVVPVSEVSRKYSNVQEKEVTIYYYDFMPDRLKDKS